MNLYAFVYNGCGGFVAHSRQSSKNENHTQQCVYSAMCNLPPFLPSFLPSSLPPSLPSFLLPFLPSLPPSPAFTLALPWHTHSVKHCRCKEESITFPSCKKGQAHVDRYKITRHYYKS